MRTQISFFEIENTLARIVRSKRYFSSSKWHYHQTFLSFRMVNVERGCLLTVDPPTKQYLLHLDERKEFRGRKFILKGYV